MESIQFGGRRKWLEIKEKNSGPKQRELMMSLVWTDHGVCVFTSFTSLLDCLVDRQF